MTLRGLRNIIFSVALGGLFLWLTFKGLDIHGLRTAFEGVNWWYLFLYFVILNAVQIIRTLRWGVMLEPVKKVSFKTLYAVSSVGFMALVLLPFRLGEFARPYLLNMKAGISVSAGVATIVVERIIDAITISIVLAVTITVLIAGGFNVPGWIVDSGVVFFAIFFILLAICVFIYLRPSMTEKICEGMFGWFSKNAAEKAIAMSREFIKGLKILPDFRRLMIILGYTLIYWCLNATGLYVMFAACGIREPSGGLLPYISSYALLCMQVVGISIPSGPAFTGPFDYFTAITVAIFAGLPHNSPGVQLYVILVHAVQLLQQSLYGLVFVITGYVGFGELIRHVVKPEEFIDPT